MESSDLAYNRFSGKNYLHLKNLKEIYSSKSMIKSVKTNGADFQKEPQKTYINENR